MGLFRRSSKQNLNGKIDKISEACGINPKNASIADYFVYGIVHYPISTKHDYRYLSSNDCMLIDETIIAYKIAKYRLERTLFNLHLSDDEFMQLVAGRVRTALCKLYNLSPDLIANQWRNRNRMLKLIYLDSKSKAFPKFISVSHLILCHDYILNEYKELSDDSPVAIIDFTKDSILQEELISFIKVFDMMMNELVNRIDLR